MPSTPRPPVVFRRAAVVALVCTTLGCGRTPIGAEVPATSFISLPEVCNRLDDDLDGAVDEDFRDQDGAYASDAHCGACGRTCAPGPNVEAVACVVPDFAPPRCVATRCGDGYAPDASGTCVPRAGWLCRPCLDDVACGGFDGARCAEIAGESRCSISCGADQLCPEGYACAPDAVCRPANGGCACTPGAFFTAYCELETSAGPCRARSECVDGIQSPCAGEPESCDGLDNDCNGVVDDPFVTERGTYGVDPQNCGGCGIDCREPRLVDAELTCGGPAVDPHCVMACPDTADGLQVGDAVDADQSIGTGCECRLRALGDTPGDPDGQGTDENCDGADGVVADSVYVAPDGDDSAPGSPAHPKATLGAAVELAVASLGSRAPRPHIYLAAGAYEEVLVLHDGLQVHGGYSPDFLRTDPASYVTEVRAPSWNASPGGAALVADAVGRTDTVVEGVRFLGASGTQAGEAAFGAWVQNPGPALRLVDCELRAGDGVDGADGADGPAGESPEAGGGAGAPPRAAAEDDRNECRAGAVNTVSGGRGTAFRCGGVDVSGGDGGAPTCPQDIGHAQSRGGVGVGEAPGGSGGRGGQDLRGPRFNDQGCPSRVCCGLADFLVNDGWETAGDGEPGRAGTDGDAGAGCLDPFGGITDTTWGPAAAVGGTGGRPGAGGGGGGAGGGAYIESVPPECAYPDGLGGGGGGGGAGGCGGGGGRPGVAGSPSIGLVVRFTGAAGGGAMPRLERVIVATGRGGLGGRGGAGGDGGAGGEGGARGGLQPEERTIPPLAGATPGGQGGHGGPGGSGGGGGGGCGGSTIGLWLEGARAPGAAEALTAGIEFEVENAAPGGPGGAGAVHGGAGADGEVVDVLER